MVLYTEMHKDLYGLLKYVLLFYLNLVGDMTKAGFKTNLYDTCLMNKIYEGDHMTVVFHVDDMKVSHKSDKAITKVIEYLNGIYPGLKAVCGYVHD